MTNTWYYTLSTISQTLAAILGLAAVFVTLRLQGIIKNVNDYKNRALYVINKKDIQFNTVQIAKIHERTANSVLKELQEIEKNYDKKYSTNSGFRADLQILAGRFEPLLNLDDKTFLSSTVDNLFIYVELRNKTINFVRFPGVVTSVSIIYTVFLLTLGDLLNKANCLRLILFYFDAFLAALSIFLIVVASWKLLDSIE